MTGPLYLGIDTASAYLALALWSPNSTLASSCEAVEREHARLIVTALDKLVAKAGAKRRDIAAIGVGIGPGSYTGLRVGVATAKGLARGLGVALAGFSSLAAMAYGGLHEGEEGVFALDARRGNVYAARFVKRAGELLELDDFGKIARETVSHHPNYFENVSPDATYLAMRAYREPKRGAHPRYL
jgi:tRNA threonylcarbamoyl adenosine modification protein YeaZ